MQFTGFMYINFHVIHIKYRVTFMGSIIPCVIYLSFNKVFFTFSNICVFYCWVHSGDIHFYDFF